MIFLEHQAKGITRSLLDADLGGEPLHVHISEVGPGQRAHPPHRHGGLEAFYMLEGEGTLEIEEETQLLRANEAAVFDPQKLHGLVNRSDAPMRYMVILVQPLDGSR
jgi:quercetin dioxygenase-like cupin family protein